MMRVDPNAKYLLWVQNISRYFGGMSPSYHVQCYPGSIRLYQFSTIETLPLPEIDISRFINDLLLKINFSSVHDFHVPREDFPSTEIEREIVQTLFNRF